MTTADYAVGTLAPFRSVLACPGTLWRRVLLVQKVRRSLDYSLVSLLSEGHEGKF